ncbi:MULTISPECIES: YmfL family putative regulatory protein [Edwardsiella]|uniref:Phage regulatory protein CII (CP76) n=2 Tax=Hafniaceae TaxID=1903412 RepID=A0ABN4SWZ3_9GAMM|nr:YmfL family putative regulatory protein [Edwardsiella hoshinae]AOV96855.1 hypothetical protein A9798_07715 [Edwardsiella hoshinae]
MGDIKDAVKAMCESMPGGRAAMAGALGMSPTSFNNRLYEKNGCKFFDRHDLEAMEDLSNTHHLADYFAARRGRITVRVQSRDELDPVELFTLATLTAAHKGQVDLAIQHSISDGIINSSEERDILALHSQYVAARDAYVRAIIALHKAQ